MIFICACLVPLFLSHHSVIWGQEALKKEDKWLTEKRESETGFLTYTEAIQLARNTCNRVDHVTSILNNPLTKLSGLSKLIKSLELPLPKNVLDPVGIIGWINTQGLRLQDVIRKIPKLKKRATPFVTVTEFLDLLDYPCKQLDLKQSFVDSQYFRWLHLGDWNVPLVDYNAERVNIWALPIHWLKILFNVGKT